ncbi:hypothetical protein AQZ52_16580 [Novosphingobium fuchskuhlense]|uniref:Uncharacterized protein n=1 Tax=Novosphingobium fuchskuhlense TaxID=1117702 RepID=A0A117UT91_9SPHN|nr:hypothetical protein [Novosphingobium fuchskuhlense]KUR70435.1 hypothetical protein AQZ52_16580 [Novosphingobium fuchskuhlense]
MNKRAITSGAAFAALLLAAPFAARAADQPVEVPFRVGEAAMAMPVPAGLCVPTGQTAALSQMTSAADTRNVTVTDFWTCGAPEKAAERYLIIKVPTQALLVRIEKASALDMFEKMLSGPDSPRYFGAGIDSQVKEGIDKVIGGQSTVKSDFGYIRRDADCVYMGGKVSIGLNTDKQPAAGMVALCMTVVGQKLVNVNLYDSRPGADITAMLADARAVAQSIHRTDPVN